MIRNLALNALILGILACSAAAASAVAASTDSLAAADSLVTPQPDSLVAPQPDSLTVPVKRDTVQAGEFTIIGDVAQPVGDTGLSADDRDQLKGTLGLIGSREVPGLRQWQRKKNAKVAMLSSALLPGLGQLYNGRRIKVGLAAGFFSYYAGNAWLNWKSAQSWTAYRATLPPDPDDENVTPEERKKINKADEFMEFYKESARDYLWWAGFVWVIGILDSWIDAHLYDLRVYTPPAELGGDASEAQLLAPGSSSRPLRYITLSIGF
jgi:hypothetical protein